MLGFIWAFMIIFSLICAHFTGRLDECVNAGLSGASDGVMTVISMCGMLALFSGLLNIAKKSGAQKALSKLIYPIISRLFPELKDEPEALGSMVLNITANILGLGNSATPLGLAAMKELDRINNKAPRASDAMCLFVILNTASVQLVPTTVIALRAQAGASNPSDVMPPVWIASVSALVVAILLALLLKRRWK